ncbi:MAG: signal peptide peptidase SppA [Planctomycetaceae bacterium]
MSRDQEHQELIQSPAAAAPAPIILQAPKPGLFERLKSWVLYAVLVGSLLANISMYAAYQDYFASAEGPSEKYRSGEREARDKLAVIRVSGTIMPPFTDRVVKAIEHAGKDEQVKGILLSIDSPGGFVSDSHQIYHQLKRLREKHQKPIVVSMGSMAASGGYYIAMGAGPQARIFAEPTTWTGSIGVIIPRYDLTGLAEKVGVRSEPLKTGEFKDALNMFRQMTPAEKAVWEDIMNQSFEQFLEVIHEGRPKLEMEKIREVATGQVFTAKDALARGLIDEIGYEEEALAALKTACGLKEARVVTYQFPTSFVDLLLGSTRAPDPLAQWRALLESAVPRAMYLCSWGLPPLPQGN